MEATSYELVGKYSREAKAFLVLNISGGDVKRKAFRVIKKEMLFTLVQPRLKILVSHSIVVNGKKYVSIHIFSALHSLIQPGGSAHLSHHNVSGIETGVHKLFLNSLRQFDIEVVFWYASRAGFAPGAGGWH